MLVKLRTPHFQFHNVRAIDADHWGVLFTASCCYITYELYETAENANWFLFHNLGTDLI